MQQIMSYEIFEWRNFQSTDKTDAFNQLNVDNYVLASICVKTQIQLLIVGVR